MKKILVIGLGCLMILGNGCASYLSYKSSEKEIYRNRIIASGNQQALKSLNMGVEPKQAIRAIDQEGVFGLMVDVTALDALGEHPFRQIGAAILDAGILYGGYLAVDSINNSGDGDGDRSNVDADSGRDTSIVTIDGDGNTVQIRGDESSVGGTTPASTSTTE